MLSKDTTLFIIRHGETDWNAEKRYQGQADIPINDRGRAQAKRNGETLKTLGLDLNTLDFVASPLVRARETMEICRAALGLDRDGYRLDPLLKELSYGAWQGMLQSDLPTQDPEGLEARNQDPYHWRPKNGESYADLVERTRGWLETVNGDSIIVTHGGILRSLHALLLGVPEHEVPTVPVPQDSVLRIRNGTGQRI